MQVTPTFTVQDKTTTACLVTDCGEFYGVAKCNPIDTFNPRAGERIAYFRAFIKAMKQLKQVDLAPRLKILNHICDIFEKNPGKYDLESPEVALIRRQTNLARDDMAMADWYIKDAQEQIQLADQLYNGQNQ